MRSLVAAPDKFRGTATATQVAAGVVAAATRRGFEGVSCPMSDGGEGFLEVVGTELRTSVVNGPLGDDVEASWSLRLDGTAVIESAQAVGRALLAAPSGDDPMRASSYGVGQLMAVAIAAGARRVVVGCGGTSSTDGGSGCLTALHDLGVELSVPIVAACDVTTTFADAASEFGPQKGATDDQVRALRTRLDELGAKYARRYGVDVRSIPGSGAAGGLAGGLVAVGASIVSGAQFAERAVGLAERLGRAELVVTGEGAVDAGTLSGKVVVAVLSVRPELPALLVAGRMDRGVLDALRATRSGRLDAIELPESAQHRVGTVGAITEAVSDYLETWP